MQIFSKYLFLLFFLFNLTSSASGDLVYSKNGMVVSASELASNVGVEILKNGGNAIDAAVATGFALAVTYPSAGNIAGGGFMVIHLANGKNTTIDFREKAPVKAFREMLLDDEGNYDPEKSLKSWASVGVPGTVAGLIYALEKYGTMKLEDILLPSIEIARNGFQLDYWLTNSINYYNFEFAKIPSSREIFTNNGEPLQIGELFVQPDLAHTLELIKDNGRDGFYKGKTAELLITQSEENGGLLSFDDLIKYEPIEREPIFSNYKNYEIIGMPPPSAGGIGVAQTLSIFQNINLPSSEWMSSKYIHTLSEIWKYVYADRANYLGDSDFYDVQIDELLSEQHLNKIFNSIDSVAVPAINIFKNKSLAPESIETTHYSVVDKYGNAVSTTYTLNSSYGNKIVVEGAGFLLNNEMDDFSAKVGSKNQFGLVGSEANSIVPGKRMLSSMSPTIVLENGKPILVVGSPGGSQIITSTLQVILNVIEYNMKINDAINSPKIHHQGLPDEIVYEKFGLSSDVITRLTKLGYKLTQTDIIGRVEGIYIDQKEGLFWGTSDKRGYGKAVGY